MMHFIKHYPLAACVVLMPSCSHDYSPNQYENIENNDTLFSKRIRSINQKYSTNRIALVVQDNGDNHQNEEKIRKSDADVQGAKDGAEIGAATLGAVGAISWGTICGMASGGMAIVPGMAVGGAAGSSVGAGIGAAIGAVVASVKASENDSTTSAHIARMTGEDFWQYAYEIDMSNPLLYKHQVILLPEDLIGANIGYWHNTILQMLFRTYSSDEIYMASIESLTGMVCEMAADSGLFYLDPIAQYDFTNLFSITYSHNHFIEPSTEDEIIEECMATICSIPSNQWKEYILSVMEEIDEIADYEGSENSLLSALYINGALSVFYYSYCIWHLHSIDPWLTNPLISDLPIQDFSTEYDWHTFWRINCAAFNNKFYFTPSYNSNGFIERLFFFKELNPYTFDSLENYIEDDAIFLPGYSSNETQFSIGSYPVCLSPDVSVYSIFIGYEDVNF